ncbi:hypothetical protein GQ42DRAFT_176891 [Ramicandelaber brevisporus]|nr:hypothetical protein GQ42DRAFT_176891 [Ramicandelaber brevisporus]
MRLISTAGLMSALVALSSLTSAAAAAAVPSPTVNPNPREGKHGPGPAMHIEAEMIRYLVAALKEIDKQAIEKVSRLHQKAASAGHDGGMKMDGMGEMDHDDAFPMVVSKAHPLAAPTTPAAESTATVAPTAVLAAGLDVQTATTAPPAQMRKVPVYRLT